VTETEFQVVKSIGFVLALALAVGLQHWRPHRALTGNWRANSALWALNAVLLGAVCAGCACTVSRWAGGAELGLLNQEALSAWVAIPASVLAMDLVSYLWHRANHHLRFLWRFHQAHHSDPTYTVTTALRFHPGELLLALPLRLLAIIVLGVPIVGVIVFEVIFAFANFCEHGNINLPRKLEGPLGGVIITPALHRRHHSRESQLLNTNYGTIFSLWDRLFGSYSASRSSELVDTGLPGIESPLGVRGILALPVRGVFRGR
jgi:sterol desaturase/sphingolipid hydroxylase (fatty acid hydroxylase superfamily)